MADNRRVKVGIGGLAVGNPTGLGRLARGYLLALAEACPDWELHVLLRSKSDAQRLADECDDNHLGLLDQLIPHFPATPVTNRLFLEEFEIPRLYKNFGFDLWLGLDFTLPRLPIAPREAVVIPDLLPFTRPGTVSWRARTLYRSAIRRAVDRQAKLICISRKTEASLHGLFPKTAGRSGVIYPPLSPRLSGIAASGTAQDTPLQVLGSLNSASGLGGYLLAVGTKGRRKNTELLVNMHREVVLQGDYTGSLVLIGGDGRHHSAPLRSDFAMQAVGSLLDQGSRSAAVYDLGRVSDHELALLYLNTDLYVNLSVEEGFGYPALEALAFGVPALVTAGSSMLEIADAGMVSTELGYEACRQTLLTTLAALPELRRAARDFDSHRFSLVTIGRDLRSALEAVSC